MEDLRILIVRLSAIGDVIHTMPVACALRDHYPAAKIVWTVEERAAELLEGHAALDELIVLRRGWLKSPRTVWQLRRRLRAMRFNLVIEAQGLTKSAVAGWLSGARRRIGLGGTWGRELSTWLNTELVNADGLHAVDRSLRLLRPLDIQSPAVSFRVPERPVDEAAAQAILDQCGTAGDFVLMTAGAGWASKLWPVDRHAAIAAHLGRRWGLPTIVVWGNEEERARAEQVAAGSEGYAQAAPKMTLMQLAALCRRARLFLGSDTGPLHLAAAVGTPCVGLYGPWPAERHGPYGSQHISVQKMCCEGSTRQRRHAPPIYMEAIDVDSVRAACDAILARTVPSEGGRRGLRLRGQGLGVGG